MLSTILVPIDISHENTWRMSLSVAGEMAQKFGGRIHIMTVVPENPFRGFYPDLAWPQILEEAKQKLSAIMKDNFAGDAPVTVSVEHGGIYPEILRVARELPADLIVMASHRPERKDYLLGSNAGHIVIHAPCSVYVVREISVTV